MNMEVPISKPLKLISHESSHSINIPIKGNIPNLKTPSPKETSLLPQINPNSNFPLLQDIGLYLITEEECESDPLINPPQSLQIEKYDRSTIDDNDENDLKKFNTMEFQKNGVFSKENRREEMVKNMKNSSKNEFFLSQNLFLNNKMKTLSALKGFFPNMRAFSFYQDFLFGSLFEAKEKSTNALTFFLFQDINQFNSFENQPVKLIKSLMKSLNLEFLIQNSNFMKKIQLFTLKSQIKEPLITSGCFKAFHKMNIADFSAETMIHKIKSEGKTLSNSFVKGLFKDIAVSVAFLTIKTGVSIAKIPLSRVFYIENPGVFFLWISNFFGFSMNFKENNPNFSIIKANNTINTISDNQTIMDLLDFGAGKRNFTMESLQMTEKDASYINEREFFQFAEEKEENLVENSKDNHCNSFKENSKFLEISSQNIETLGKFLINLLEIAELHKRTSFNLINLMNEELYFAFYENFYLNTNTMESYKARNFLHFFLDSDKSNRIEFISLLHYFDHLLLKPWKNLDFLQMNFTEISSNFGLFVFSSGFIYEGEFRFSDQKKILQGKGLLKRREIIDETDEIIYEGNWKNNRFHGKGVLYLFGRDIYCYKGEFRNGKCHGFGEILLENKSIFKGNFFHNNYYPHLIEKNVMLNEIFEENIGCFAIFQNPIKGFTKEIEGFMGVFYEEFEFYEIIEVNFLCIKPKETHISKICEFIIKKLKSNKQFLIIHFLIEENIWVIDGFDFFNFRQKLRLYISKKPLIVKRLTLVLKYLRAIYEDLALKIVEFEEEIPEIQAFLTEISLRFSWIKLKKLDILKKTSLGNGFKGKEALQTLVSSFILHKLKRLVLKAVNLTDEFFEILKKSPFLSSLEDFLIKNSNKITEISFMNFSEISNLSSLRNISIIRTSITNKGLSHLIKAEFFDSLEKLNISENFLLNDEGFIDLFKKKSMKSLKKLYLSWLRISESSLKILLESKHFPSLKKLKLIKCPVFEFFSLEEPFFLKNLVKIDLSRTFITKTALMNLIKIIPMMRILNLSYCTEINPLDLKLIMAISELKMLKKLDLRGLRILPSHLDYLLKNTNKIKALFLKRNQLIVSETLSNILRANSNIFEIDVSYTAIGDQAFSEFRKSSRISDLRNFFLKKTQISDLSLSVLFEQGLFPQLRVLNIAYTAISDKGMNIIAENLLVGKLYDLNIAGCENITNNGIFILLHYFPNSYLKRLNISFLKISREIILHRNFFFVKATSKLIYKGIDMMSSLEIKTAISKKLTRKKEDYKEFLKENLIDRWYKSLFEREEILEEEAVKKELNKGILLENIEKLDFSDNKKVNIEKMLILGNFLMLKELNIENCEVSDRIITIISFSSSVKFLKKLNLNKTNVTDLGLFQISVSLNFKNLSHLDIAECSGITDAGVLDILKSLIVQIEGLDVSGTKVGDVMLNGVRKGLENGKMESLKEIWMYFCDEVSEEKVKAINKEFNVFVYF